MNQTLEKELSAKGAFLIFLLLSVWWVSINLHFLTPDNFAYDLFSDVYGVMALWGGLWGLRTAKQWGGVHSVMGRMLLAFSVGLLCQVFGQVVYSFYFYYLHVDNPYPSIGDIGFYATIPAYIYGVIQVGKVAGVHWSVDAFKKNPVVIVLPLLLLFATYKLFLEGYEFDWSAPLTVFLDLVNPLGQAIYISMAFLVFILSQDKLGGIMRSNVLLLLGALLAQYLADFIFLYKTSREAWVSGGISEYLYLVAYFIMTIGVIKLSLIFRSLKDGNN